QIAQNILVKPLLALNFVESARRCIDIEQREMRLPVLAQPIGQGLYAPLLRLCDLASRLLNHAFELRRELFDLLRARVLARQEYVFIERHADAFPRDRPCLPAQSPSSLFGKGSNARRRKHGTSNQ